MKYPYIDKVIDRYIELFKNEKINSVKEFVDNQEKYCKDIIENYKGEYKKIPYTSFRYYFKKRDNYSKFIGEKIGEKNYNSTDYTEKEKEKTDTDNKSDNNTNTDNKSDNDTNTDNKSDNDTNTDNKSDNENEKEEEENLELKKNIENLGRIKNTETNTDTSPETKTDKNNEVIEKEGFEFNFKNTALIIAGIVVLFGGGYMLYKSITQGGEVIEIDREGEQSAGEKTGENQKRAGTVQDTNTREGYWRP